MDENKIREDESNFKSTKVDQQQQHQVFPPEGWLVKHQIGNKTNKALFLEREKAEQYAAKWRGTVIPLYSPGAFRTN